MFLYFREFVNVQLNLPFLSFDGLVKTLDLKDEKYQDTRALILVPTRELSEQISAYLRGFLFIATQMLTSRMWLVGLRRIFNGQYIQLKSCIFSDMHFKKGCSC